MTSHSESCAGGKRALVFGASGGIGGAVVRQLEADPDYAVIFAASRNDAARGCKTIPLRFDLMDEASIASTVQTATAEGSLDLVFVATGLLHDDAHQPEKTFRALSATTLDHLFRVNATGPALIAKHALPHLRKDKRAAFAVLSARVGSISDNRLGGWHSYRASKAALNMMIRTFAIELARTHPEALCVALHPGTVDTQLSKPFQKNVPEGKLFTGEESARALLTVLGGLGARASGGLFAWNGEKIDF